MKMNRRDFLRVAGAAHLAGLLPAQGAAAQEGAAFNRATVIDIARRLSQAEFVAPATVAEPLLELSFADYHRIQAKPETWLYTEPPTGFAVEPLHAGFIYREPVELYAVQGEQAVKLSFDPANFAYPGAEGLPPEGGLEFAGFRAHTTLNAADRMEPFLIFAGASYFQAVARGQVFGLSARGLAIGTGEQSGEEFPSFRAFWLEQPRDGRMVAHALLDSPSVTGAYRFTIRPGDQTLIDVEAILFARAEITRLGLAPLTGMHLFGPLGPAAYDDTRQAVHDVDGLSIWNGKDERIWRPLSNPRLLHVSAFKDSGPRGFGLIQREKRFSEYEDLAGQPNRRPSAWVEPIGDWGAGNVVLVEIPSDREINDNIVAFWRPETPVAAGSEITLTYRLTWNWDAPGVPGLLRVTRTLTGAAGPEGVRRFVVDFSEPGAANGASAAGLTPKAATSVGAISNVVLEENPAIGGVRVSFDLDPDGQEAADLRLDLLREGKPAAEVWVYLWTI